MNSAVVLVDERINTVRPLMRTEPMNVAAAWATHLHATFHRRDLHKRSTRHDEDQRGAHDASSDPGLATTFPNKFQRFNHHLEPTALFCLPNERSHNRGGSCL